LQWVMGHRGATMLFSLGILIGTGVLFVMVPKGFIPSQDIGAVFGTIEAAEGTGFDAMSAHVREVGQILQNDKNVEGVMVSAGAGGYGTANQGRVNVYLKPRSERSQSADEMLRTLAPKFAQVPGVRVFVSNPPAIRVGGRSSKSQYQFTLQSPDIEALYESAAMLEAKLRDERNLADVTSDLQIRNPQVKIDIDRDRAAALGLGVDQVEGALYNAYGSRQISTIYTPNNDYMVIMELLPQFQRDAAALNMLYIRSKSNALVPLASVATLTPTMGPLSVNHSGQLPSVTLSFNL